MQSIKKLHDVLLKRFPNLDEWLSESITHEFGDSADVVQAAILASSTDLPWTDIRAFEKIVVALNDREVIGDIFQELDAREIAYGVSTLQRDFPEEQFNDDVCKFIAYRLQMEGIVIAPPSLEFVQPFITLMQLSADQQQVQRAYMEEVESYIKLMNSGKSEGNVKEVTSV